MFSPVSEVIQAIVNGEIVVLTDDEDRENEGDLICAASLVTQEKINFILQYGRGVLCVPIAPEVAKRLELSVPTGKHDSRGTAFSQSLDAINGTTTGVSASDRAKSILEIVRSDSKIEDFYSPGHIYPLLAKENGVLERIGHTEGTIDLVKLAKLPPVGVLCEILNPDGTMARLDDLKLFCQKHRLKLCSIESIVAYLHENQ